MDTSSPIRRQRIGPKAVTRIIATPVLLNLQFRDDPAGIARRNLWLEGYCIEDT